eukprot:m.92469 g.92469  ORF g.92469 m.92469 type:complete len:81 (+) comp12357_c1_seq1:134-376(+)
MSDDVVVFVKETEEGDGDVIKEIHEDAARVGSLPLPDGLEGLSHEDTVCKFCGVSYLIHREVKRLQVCVFGSGLLFIFMY